MKKIATGLASLSLLSLLSLSAIAYDKDLKEHVRINDKVLVNGTVVKPGYYLIRYNSSTGEMSIRNGSKVVATAAATVTVSGKKFDHDAILTKSSSSGEILTGVRLGGQREELDLSGVAVEISQDNDVDDFTPDMGW